MRVFLIGLAVGWWASHRAEAALRHARVAIGGAVMALEVDRNLLEVE